ncbi:uncharacterized protein LOC130966314 [Arachis stenosperma]|uniref:uncharacterized protein LOC130966314 n=1 Tax=Arachis stenosperma TaxID=217475 RepID=UPI0025ACF14B|nr:uncharacterized protein LOC130966314 [Arachis stenosperma]
MGNCQAVDAAALVIQHPNGKMERLYWPVSATEVMRNNPGHYVSLIIPLPVAEEAQHQQKNKNHIEDDNNNNNNINKNSTLLVTHVKLLRPNETLTLGHAYRLITTQDVVKVLRARKLAKLRKPLEKTSEMVQTVHHDKKSSVGENEENLNTGSTYQTARAERQKLRAAPVNPPAPKMKPWRPSLQSISEAGI